MDHHNVTSPVGDSTPYLWRATTTGEVLSIAHNWLSSSTLITVLMAFGFDGDPSDEVRRLSEWSWNILDTRGGSERHLASDVEFQDDQIDALISAAGPLGLLSTRKATKSEYDVVIVLGGTSKGNLRRARLAKHLIDNEVAISRLVGLATDRTLTPAETRKGLLASRGDTESAHLERVFHTLFSTDDDATSTDNFNYRSNGYTNSQMIIETLVAPPSAHGSRANTASAIEYLSRLIGESERESVLIVTSAIYAPYQFLITAPILLNTGSKSLELIGTETPVDGSRSRLAQQIAQEIHSAIVAIGSWLTK
jgi:hypothetical protein